MYIVDASIILKWFVEENGSKEAIAIRDCHIANEYSIVIPDISIYEVANALRYKPHSSPIEVSKYCNDLYDLGLNIISLSPALVNLAIELTFQKDITFYDATYLALAKELGFRFLTADKKLYEKVKSLHFIDLLAC